MKPGNFKTYRTAHLTKSLLNKIKSGKIETESLDDVLDGYYFLEDGWEKFLAYEKDLETLASKRHLFAEEDKESTYSGFMRFYGKIIEKIKNSEIKIKYFQRILALDENSKAYFNFQLARAYYKEDDKQNVMHHLNMAFDLLQNDNDKVIDHKDIKLMSLMYQKYNELVKSASCSVFTEKYLIERSKTRQKEVADFWFSLPVEERKKIFDIMRGNLGNFGFDCFDYDKFVGDLSDKIDNE